MKNKTKIPLLTLFLCIGAYANQGISSLPEQCIYYLSRETWGLSASMIGLISWVTGISWYIKILWGYIADKTNNVKRNLIIAYTFLLLLYGYVIIFGLTLVSLIVIGLLVNCCIGFADTNVDKRMVITEKKLGLKGRLQAIQWTALGVAGLVVALGGAYIAKYSNYRVAYALAGIIPIAMIGYLCFFMKKESTEKKKPIDFRKNFTKIKNRRLIMGLVFIACLNFCPSFGTSLMIKVREVMHVDKLFLGYLGAMGTVLGIIGYIIYYKWAYKFPMKKLLYFMVIFSGLTNLFYLYIPNQWFLVAYNLAFGACGGIMFMVLLNFFVSIIPNGSEGFFYALVTSVSNFSARGGNFLGGLIYDKWGYAPNVILSSVLTLACVAFIPALKIGEDK